MTGPTNPKKADRWEDQVPILDAASGVPDPVALATWHMAMSTLVAGELPHEILALWVFPTRGGVVLLGPEELAQSQPAVPEPRPHLTQDQLFDLEEIFRRAKYGSVIAVPVRTQAVDVALMLLAAFAPGRFGAQEALSLHWIAKRLGPSLASLADLLVSVGQQAAIEPALTPEELPRALSRAAVEAPTGADLVRRLSGLLHALVPYDRLEIVAAMNGMNGVTALGSGPARRRWSAAGTTWIDVVGFLEAERERSSSPAVLAIDDWVKQAEGLCWPGAPAGHPGRIGSAIAVKMTLGGNRVGWLIAAHSAPNMFRLADEDVIELAARLLAPRIASLRLEAELDLLGGRLEVLMAPSLPVLRAAEALAGTAHLGEALHRIGHEVRELIPHQRIRYLLRAGEDRVVELTADAIRPLADLPTALLTESPAQAVIEGERDWLLTRTGEGEALIVALRVADRITGAMVIEAESFDAPRVSAGSALQFAAVIAPHLELVRRAGAGRAQPPIPFAHSAQRP